eukprot:30118-Hanusia_phi.AAC.2
MAGTRTGGCGRGGGREEEEEGEMTEVASHTFSFLLVSARTSGSLVAFFAGMFVCILGLRVSIAPPAGGDLLITSPPSALGQLLLRTHLFSRRAII